MAYDKAFYDMYREYLREESVRTSHNFVFEQFLRTASLPIKVIDLGCGLSEFYWHGLRSYYLGVDLNMPNYPEGFLPVVQADYHDLDTVKKQLHFTPSVFVSLFSVECFHSAVERYAFYERVFKEFPDINFGLVSGFFYESKRDQETVGETGGIVSYQTIENPSLHISNTFTELRLHVRTPSKMFGPDVVEVWKIFIRR